MADPKTKNGKADVNFDRMESSLFLVAGTLSLLAELFNAWSDPECLVKVGYGDFVNLGNSICGEKAILLVEHPGETNPKLPVKCISAVAIKSMLLETMLQVASMSWLKMRFAVLAFGTWQVVLTSREGIRNFDLGFLHRKV